MATYAIFNCGLTPAAGSATAGPDVRPAPTLVELDTDRDAVGEEVLPSHMQSYASVPLGSLLDPKIKATIWAKQYVDLELLVGETTYETTFMLDPATSKTFVNVKDQATQQNSTMRSWFSLLYAHSNILLKLQQF